MPQRSVRLLDMLLSPLSSRYNIERIPDDLALRSLLQRAIGGQSEPEAQR